MKRIGWILFGLITFSFIAGAIVYPYLPERVASHWNAAGQVDGYSGRFVGAYLMPIIVAILTGLLWLIPRVDPLKANIEKFKKYYQGFILVFILFMILVYSQTLLWNFGIKISPMIIIPFGFAGLIYYVAILLNHAEQNWFIGIRTPWTLSCPAVWKKTHQLGAKLYKFSALIALIGVLFPKFAIIFVLAPILSVSIYLVIYSYLEFKKAQ